MADHPALPRPNAALTARGDVANADWYRFFRTIAGTGTLTDAQLAAVAADLAAIATALGSPDGSVDGIPELAIPATTDQLPEGALNRYFTEARVLALLDTVAAPSAAVPTLVADGDTYTVAEHTQALFALPIELDGDALLVVDGALVEVN